ncbi:MAG: NAD(P)H-dependent oxidoreductase [Atopobiaceae bacterium]|jgi:NAD(P)H dehydrogenase (quinone)
MSVESLDTLIVYCHPWEMSYTHEVLCACERSLSAARRSYEVIDLYADGFMPAMTVDELSVYNQGVTEDALVKRYQELLLACKHLILVFPVWWNDVPAMLRGWLDRTMLPGFAWEATGKGIVGKLSNIESVDAFTTSSNPTSYMQERLGDGIQHTLLDATFWQLGCGKGRWHNLGGIDITTEDERAQWLLSVEDEVAHI